MKHKRRCGQAFLAKTCPADQVAGMVRRFFCPDFPSYDITAEDIDDKVQVKEDPFDRS
jgi:hypothetical protein